MPLVYEELRRLAARKLAREAPGQTLQATALVHEAYLRLVDVEKVQHWDSRGHFFAAAAEAMRRILVEKARRKRRLKRGGAYQRVAVDEVEISSAAPGDDVIALDAALTKLAVTHPQKAELVKLRYFVGLTVSEAAEALRISPPRPSAIGPMPAPGSIRNSCRPASCSAPSILIGRVARDRFINRRRDSRPVPPTASACVLPVTSWWTAHASRHHLRSF